MIYYLPDLPDIINYPDITNYVDLIGYYKFNAGTGTILYDHSGNQNHGTLMNMDESDWVENIEFSQA